MINIFLGARLAAEVSGDLDSHREDAQHGLNPRPLRLGRSISSALSIGNHQCRTDAKQVEADKGN